MGRLRFAGVALLVLSTACAGPQEPLEVGIKEFPTDVLLGAPDEESPTGPVNVDPGLPVVIERRIVRTAPPPLPPLSTPEPACPTAHPFDAPRLEATNRAMRPPVEGTYAFRTKGSIELDGSKFPLAPTTFRTISNVSADTDAFSFDVEAGQVTTSWRVVPEGSNAGIFMTRQVTQSATGETTFEPTPPVKFLEFPAEPGREWDSVGTDTRTGTTMALSGRVGVEMPDPDDPEATVLEAKARVDACGEVLDAWYVEIRGPQAQGNARIVSPTSSLELRGTYAFATQYGGLSIADVVQLEGQTVAGQLKTVQDSTINAEPGVPEG